MKTIKRRDKLKLYGDLLAVLSEEANAEKIVLTRIQVKINVNFDRLMTYISELCELGLIEDKTSLKITEKGKQYLLEYEYMLDFMDRMGLTYQ